MWEFLFLAVRLLCLGLWYGTWGLFGMTLCWATLLILLALGFTPGW